MSDIVEYRGDLKKFVNDTILKYCPYSEDRWDELHRKISPEMDIEIRISEDKSHLMFLYGDSTSKSSIEERVHFPYSVSFEEICDIIDAVLEDHKFIDSIRAFRDRIEMSLVISWCNEALKGITCGDIGLNITFDNEELEKEYFLKLVQKYYEQVQRTQLYTKIKDEYIKDMQKTYFDGLDKTQLIELLNEMNEDELRKLLKGLDLVVFRKYLVKEDKEETKTQLIQNYVKKAF